MPEFNADVILNQQQYNEEIEGSPLYRNAKEWEGKVVLENFNWEQKVLGIPLPKAITEYIDFGTYVLIRVC